MGIVKTSLVTLSKEYTKEENQLWREMSHEMKPLRGNLCPEFSDGLAMFGIYGEGIPNVAEINALLFAISGWTLFIVSNMINIEMKFFARLLAEKKFPVCLLMRRPEHRAFSPYPDLWHDLHHAAILTNRSFGNFLQALGKWGMGASGPEAEQAFWRIYNRVGETGLMRRKANGPYEIIGAACASSWAEAMRCLSPEVKRNPFCLARVMENEYDDSELQPEYVFVESFEQLSELVIPNWSR